MGFLTDILAGLPLNALLREKIADAEKKYTETVDELGRCKDQCADLLKQLAEYRQRDQHPQKDYELDLPEITVLRQFAAEGRNTIDADGSDPAVRALVDHHYLTFAVWMERHDGPTKVRLTAKGQRAVEEIASPRADHAAIIPRGN